MKKLFASALLVGTMTLAACGSASPASSTASSAQPAKPAPSTGAAGGSAASTGAATGASAASTGAAAGASAASTGAAAGASAASTGAAAGGSAATTGTATGASAASSGASAGGSATSGTASTPAAGSSAAAAGPATKLTVSYSAVIGTELPIWVADAAGIFKQNGLDVNVQYIESSKGIPALLSGQTQVADLGGSETLSAVAAGADLVTVACDGPVWPFLLQVPASIKTAADLKGKKIGVSQFGSASDIATRVGLQHEGLDPNKDVTILAVGSASTRIAAMQSGAIQGGLSYPPASVKLEKQGFHTLFDEASLKLPGSSSSAVVKRSFLTSNRATVQKYVDSLMQATARIKKDKPLTVSVLEKYYKSNDAAAMGAAYDYFAKSVLPSEPYPKPNQYSDAQTILGAKNQAVKNYDVSKMLDESFVKNAADRGIGK